MSHLPPISIGLVKSLLADITASLKIFFARLVCGGRQFTSQKFKRRPFTDTAVPLTSRKWAVCLMTSKLKLFSDKSIE